jgi:hypothetical protein
MSEEEYDSAIEIVRTCHDNQVCIEFIDGHDQPAEGNGASAAGAVAGPVTPAEV